MSQTRGSVKSNFVQRFISKARFEPSFLTIELKLGDSIQTGQCCIIANICSSFFPNSLRNFFEEIFRGEQIKTHGNQDVESSVWSSIFSKKRERSVSGYAEV